MCTDDEVSHNNGKVKVQGGWHCIKERLLSCGERIGARVEREEVNDEDVAR